MADVDVNESVTLYKEALHVYESNNGVLGHRKSS
eukprot:CAMPEP_0175879474 /NCGR_PEP_ID=MMETSP0107_2-20121207/41779_1 /TAXON_ID=195067 ORGANISM="Goniomonas pacifica, Strain CCMP1869" /NCGR_SAMPLE_ID=MMETSP0107_2 /ASSEMBLY_ACC=CAM_ASM_000203 /LENGTH=33 /DNA_ID= /DNA_START= /DNA_END= /DNA_ORIENTATION=